MVNFRYVDITSVVDTGKIKLAVDSSYIAAGAVLMQEDKEGIDRPVLYESVTFSAKESEYAQSKLELLGVAKINRTFWGQTKLCKTYYDNL